MRIRLPTHTSLHSPLAWLGLASTLCLACGITPLLAPGSQACSTGGQGCPGPGGASGTNERGWTVEAGGYVIAGSWQGYAWTAASTENGSTITLKDFPALAAGGPLCASGSVASQYDWGGYAMIGVNLNQAQSKDAPMNTVVPTSAGVSVDVTDTGGSQLRVQISGPAGATDPNDRWCVPIAGSGGFIPWGSFNTACWGGYGNAYNGEPLTQIAILVPGSNSVAVPFNFCINSIVPSTGSSTGGTGGGGAAGGAPAGSPVAQHGRLKV